MKTNRSEDVILGENESIGAVDLGGDGDLHRAGVFDGRGGSVDSVDARAGACQGPAHGQADPEHE